jgi:hypothetical protein
MNLKHFLLFLLAIDTLSLLAQTPMVAYRKEGIWHYFDTQGKPLWEPFMDVARFPAGWRTGLFFVTIVTSNGVCSTARGSLRNRRLMNLN